MGVSNYPNALDVFRDPSDNTLMNQPGYGHAEEHTLLNDAVAAIEAALGTTTSPGPLLSGLGGGGGNNLSWLPANPTGITTNIVTPDEVSGANSATILVTPQDQMILGIKISGDLHPRWMLPSDSGNGLYLGDGTIDPYNGANISYEGPPASRLWMGSQRVSIQSSATTTAETTLQMTAFNGGGVSLAAYNSGDINVLSVSGNVTVNANPSGGVGGLLSLIGGNTYTSGVHLPAVRLIQALTPGAQSATADIFVSHTNPTGVVTANQVGDLCIQADPAGYGLWQASATDNAHWQLVGSNATLSSLVLTNDNIAPSVPLGASYSWFTLGSFCKRGLVWRMTINQTGSTSWGFQVSSQPNGAGEIMFQAGGISAGSYSISWPWVYENQDTPADTNFYIGFENSNGTTASFTITEMRTEVFL